MSTSDLMRRLSKAGRAWRRTCAVEWFLRSLKFICAAVLLLVTVDLIAQLGPVPRLIMSVTGGVAFLIFAVMILRRALGGQKSLLPIARVLEGRDESLGSKLVNVIQLQEKADDQAQPALTRKLAVRAVEQAAADVEGRDFVPLTKSPTMARSFRLALIPVAFVVVPVLIFSPIAGREIMRFVDPFGDHPPFSFTRLQIVTPEDDATRVVYHRPVTVEVEYDGHRPREVFLTVESADDSSQRTTIPMFAQGDERFVQQIDQVDADLVVRAHTKTRRSISEARHIGVILTPQLEAASVRVRAPAYTKLSERNTKLGLEKSTAPTLSVLTGSEIEFTLSSNRPLSEGSVGLVSANPDSLEIPLRAEDDENPNQASATLKAVESGRLRFDLRDITGLPADRELAANLVVTHDLPPEINITEPASDGFIVDTFSANVAFRATDDYGLKSVRLHAGVNDVYGEAKNIRTQLDPPQRDALETIHLAPSKMGAVPGDVISVFAEATDIRPEPQMARTRTLRLQVISEEEYNEYLRMKTEIRDLERKYSTLHDELRDLAREQRQLAEEAENAVDDPDQKVRDDLAARQSELNRKLEKLAEKMESATRDKPLYDLERDLQEVLDEEARKIRDSIAQNRQGTENFLDSSPSEQSMREFSSEGEAQADRLDPARKQAEEKIAEALQDADKIQQLLKDINAYRQLYEIQKDLAAQTAAYKTNPDLSHDDRLALQQMAGSERLVGEGLDQIVESLREGAKNAEEAFPEAAQDARKIADAIENANLSALAAGAARTMLTGRAEASHDKAEHLRQEMEKLMSQCGQCQGGMGSEFTMRLKLMHNMLAGDTFSQMAQCRNFGLNLGMGQSVGGGGAGMAGMMGTGNSQMGPQMSLLGGESMLGQNGPESATPSEGKAQGTPSPDVSLAGRKGEDAGSGPVRENRPSKAITGDVILDEYGEIVDAYFQKLTNSEKGTP